MIRRLAPIAVLALTAFAAAQTAPIAESSATSRPVVDASHWSFDLSHAQVRQAWIAADTIYLDLPNAMRDGHDGFDATPALRPLTYPNGEGFTDGPAIAAIDAATGAIRWCRPYVGEFRFALDPDGRDLWAFAGTVHRLDAATGKSTFEQSLPASPAEKKPDLWHYRTIAGLRRDGRPILPGTDDPYLTWAKVRLYDVDAKAIVDAAVSPRSPNKLMRIDVDIDQSPTSAKTSVLAHAIDGATGGWRYVTPGPSGNRPVPIGDDVLVLSGQETSMAIVARLRGDTGAVRWSARLPRGAYVPTRSQHRDGTYGTGWPAVGVLGDHLAFAIGGDGAVILLDADTGALRAEVPTGRVHLCAPRVVGDQLVVVNEDRIRAVPLAVATGEAKAADVDAALARARAANGHGSGDEALGVVQVLADQMPCERDVWAVLAESAADTDADDEYVRAAVRWLELGHDATEPWLKEHFGLLARIETGAVLAPIADLGLFLYAPSTDGLLYVIDPQTLQVVERRTMCGDAESAKIRGNLFVRRGEDRVVETLLALPDPPATPTTRDDPLFSPFDRWQSGGWMGDRIGPLAEQKSAKIEPIANATGVPRQIGDRLVVSLMGGGAGEWIGGEWTTFAATLDGVANWSIQPTSDGFLGVGPGGCYALDEHFRPTRFLVDLRDATHGASIPSVEAVEADATTLATLTRDRQMASELTLGIRSRDGTRVIREANVLAPGRGDNLRDENARLFRLGDGYFYAGGELVWVPLDPKRPVWRFRANDAPTPKPSDDVLDHSFGVPRVRDGKLFVACHRGGVFVFDVARITR